MHAKKEDLPIPFEMPGIKFGMQTGQGGMAMSYWEMPAGPMETIFEGLPNNSCPCPHWGYLLKGKMTVYYDNGESEVLKGGEVYYMAPGHIAQVDKDVAGVEFSPEKELIMVLDHIKKKMNE